MKGPEVSCCVSFDSYDYLDLPFRQSIRRREAQDVVDDSLSPGRPHKLGRRGSDRQYVEAFYLSRFHLQANAKVTKVTKTKYYFKLISETFEIINTQ